MKVAAHPATWKSAARLFEEEFSLEAMYGEVAELGIRYVEGALPKERDVAGYRKMLAAHGLELAAVGTSVTANPHPPNMEQYRAAIEFAAELGVPILMVCGGFLANNRRTTYPEDYDLFAESLKPAIDYAAEHQITLAYHPHRGCIVETVAETAMMIKRIPELRLTVDIAHLASVGEDPLGFIKRFGERIEYTHIKDYDSRTRNFVELGMGNGSMNVAACVDALAEAGYRGFLCIERDGTMNEPRSAAESTRIGLDYLRPWLQE